MGKLGNAWGGKEHYIGNYKSADCIAKCKTYSDVRGVTMASSVTASRSGKCWCEAAVKGQNNEKDYKACFLPKDVDGGWSGHGYCSASCGGGYRYRRCDNPSPVGNGKNCTGSHRRFCYLAGCPCSTRSGAAVDGCTCGVSNTICSAGQTCIRYGGTESNGICTATTTTMAPRTTTMAPKTTTTKTTTTEDKTEDCQKSSTKGKDYRGTVSVTKSGKTCQAWNVQSPQKHGTYTEKNREESGLGEHNYCRNVGGNDVGVWCYTTDPNKRLDYCDVPVCEDKTEDCQKSSTKGKDYRGTVSVTKSGNIHRKKQRRIRSWRT